MYRNTGRPRRYGDCGLRLFIVIRRDPGETHADFLEWWSDHHAEIAKDMPGLRRYVLHDVREGFEKDLQWDGLAELEFESVDAARAAFASDAGRRSLEDTKGRGGARLMLSTDILRVVRAE